MHGLGFHASSRDRPSGTCPRSQNKLEWLWARWGQVPDGLSSRELWEAWNHRCQAVNDFSSLPTVLSRLFLGDYNQRLHVIALCRGTTRKGPEGRGSHRPGRYLSANHGASCPLSRFPVEHWQAWSVGLESRDRKRFAWQVTASRPCIRPWRASLSVRWASISYNLVSWPQDTKLLWKWPTYG